MSLISNSNCGSVVLYTTLSGTSTAINNWLLANPSLIMRNFAVADYKYATNHGYVDGSEVTIAAARAAAAAAVAALSGHYEDVNVGYMTSFDGASTIWWVTYMVMVTECYVTVFYSKNVAPDQN